MLWAPIHWLTWSRFLRTSKDDVTIVERNLSLHVMDTLTMLFPSLAEAQTTLTILYSHAEPVIGPNMIERLKNGSSPNNDMSKAPMVL